MIGERKIKEAVPHKVVSRIFLGEKSYQVPQNHYQIKGRIFRNWDDDWLTVWQRKNEG